MTATLGLGVLVYGLVEAGGPGFADARFIISLASGAALLVLFVFVERRRGARAMMPLRLFRAVFGIGSILGIMLMSALVALPVRLTAARFKRAQLTVRGLAGLFSMGFGLFTVYQIGFVEGLLL